MMSSFKRARNDEQRTERRRKILDTAAVMLTEMPVAKVSLNELSRRVCLAKSNVLRYFESREAILLELLDAEERAWLAELSRTFEEFAKTEGDLRQRGDRMAAVIAESLAERPVLCDLLGAQSSVLEHNVSAEVAARYKRATLQNYVELAGLIRNQLPEIGEFDALRLSGSVGMLAGGIWSHTNPSPAMLAAYTADPTLAALRLEFAPTVTELFRVLITGVLTRNENLPVPGISATPAH
ncbi:AcrR family transcriptional regulator [Nocardia transvalensis]|uniref:AcrR family transcriptional regulator n=2 Tax=Nocardia transvalensis TaxID=37333 RepID=A0A7W9PGA1_9NOCA|nr:AcrR family transcriptional regulator [Nocardia transvalensis]